jgi:hypothetical protein
MRLEGVFPLRALRGEYRDCWAQRAWVPGIWRCALLQDALPVIEVSATPVRRGVAFLMSSGGGALLATGYFLAAFQAETQPRGGHAVRCRASSLTLGAMPLEGVFFRWRHVACHRLFSGSLSG